MASDTETMSCQEDLYEENNHFYVSLSLTVTYNAKNQCSILLSYITTFHCALSHTKDDSASKQKQDLCIVLTVTMRIVLTAVVDVSLNSTSSHPQRQLTNPISYRELIKIHSPA